MGFSVRISPIAAFWGTLLAYLWIASYFGADLSQSMWSVLERGIGLMTMTFVWLIFIVLSQSFASLFLRRVIVLSFSVSILVAFYGACDALVSGTRADVVFGNAAFLASYLLLHGFIGLYLARTAASSRTCVVLHALSFFFFVVVGLTGMRGAVLGLVAGLFALFAYDSFALRRRMPAAFAIILFLVSAGFFLTRNMAVWQGVPVLGRFSGTASEVSGGRAVAWTAAVDAVQARPLLGWGFENFDYAFNASYRSSFSAVVGAEDFFSKPHNIFLEYAVSGGIPGCILFIVFLAVVFRSLLSGAIPSRGKPALFGFLAAYITSQFFLFDTSASLVPFVLVLAYIASYAPSRPLSRIVSRASVVFVSLFLLFFAYGLFLSIQSSLSVSRAVSAMASGDTASAFSAWRAAHDAGGPYRHSIARRYAAHLQDAVSRGIDLPDGSAHAVRAMSALEAAIAAHPENYFYRTAYADAAPAFSRYDAAYLSRGAAHAEHAVSLSPHRAEGRYLLAKIRLKQGDPAQALSAMREAVALDPESGDAHFLYGFVLLSAGRDAEGFAEVSRAAELGRLTRTAGEAKLLADWHGDAGDYPAALYEYDRALSHDPDNPDILFNRALVLYYRGDRGAARDAFSAIAARFAGFTGTSRYQAASPILRLLGLPIAP